jgi:DNA-binding transcriptional regulator YhcF (GntR family)
MSREAARIAPPSGLRVNRQSAVPVHVQLTSQIRHLIGTGALKPGMQLPTVRQLAGFLRINRNTAARALADLHRDGYLECQKGRGTFVVDRPPAREGRAARSLERMVSDMLDRARRLGFTQDEVLATVAARAPQRAAAGRPRPVRALLVECNWEELARYRDQLESELPLTVDRILVEELPARAAQDPALFGGYRVIVTTFFHVHEVKRVVPADGPPVVALLSAANISTLLRLTELPEGTAVGLVCTTSTGSQNLLRSVQAVGLGHVDAILASADDPWSIARMLEKTRIVLCSAQGASRIRDTLPPDVELIVSDRTLDPGGLELLRDLLSRPEEEPQTVGG